MWMFIDAQGMHKTTIGNDAGRGCFFAARKRIFLLQWSCCGHDPLRFLCSCARQQSVHASRDVCGLARQSSWCEGLCEWHCAMDRPTQPLLLLMRYQRTWKWRPGWPSTSSRLSDWGIVCQHAPRQQSVGSAVVWAATHRGWRAFRMWRPFLPFSFGFLCGHGRGRPRIPALLWADLLGFVAHSAGLIWSRGSRGSVHNVELAVFPAAHSQNEAHHVALLLLVELLHVLVCSHLCWRKVRFRIWV